VQPLDRLRDDLVEDVARPVAARALVEVRGLGAVGKDDGGGTIAEPVERVKKLAVGI
jgi:hypothetical protein